MTPDVNVLVAAFRDDHPHHAAARAWLNEALEDCASGGTLEILPMVAAGFARLVTDRKAFRIVVEARAAFAFIESILKVPGATMLQLGAEWPAFEKLCVDRKLAGADLSDGWIAAAVKTNGLRLVTLDADFARLLDPAECLLLEPRAGVQERSPTYVVRRMSRRATAVF